MHSFYFLRQKFFWKLRPFSSSVAILLQTYFYEMFHIYALFHQTTSLGWCNSAVRIYFPCLNNRALPRYRLWVILCRHNRALPLGKNTFACLFIAYNRTGLPRYEQVSLMRLLLGNTSHIIEMLFPSSSPLFYLLIFLPLSHLFFFFFWDFRFHFYERQDFFGTSFFDIHRT